MLYINVYKYKYKHALNDLLIYPLSATSNGHAGGSRNHRRSMDKDKHRNKGDAADSEHNNGARHGGKNSSNNYHQVDSGAATATTTVTATSSNSKDKDKDKEKSDWDSSTNYPQQQQQQQQGGKEKHGEWLAPRFDCL